MSSAKLEGMSLTPKGANATGINLKLASALGNAKGIVTIKRHRPRLARADNK